ncbi:MAG: LD-carboxypeptidase [Lachnospiraceae bacterium]|nr:LD-carboxypeptidase [Lachnospiraceae bacterium]
MRMEKGGKAAIVCCSNGLEKEKKSKIERLEGALRRIGLVPVFSDHIYAEDSVFSGSGEERAKDLMKFYLDDEIEAIFDVSGGDIANEILPYLDFDVIARKKKYFWGYSDLTTVINAIYARTGRESVLYQVRNLVKEDAARQTENFSGTVLRETEQLFSFGYEFVQKERMQGIVVGGNIRCLLKLAGTPYWPNMHGKLLLLESWHGLIPQMVTYLSQLQQLGVFEQANGILLGTFTQMEEEGCCPSITELVKKYAGNEIPIAKTKEIGHGADSKGIVIGRELRLGREGRQPW